MHDTTPPRLLPPDQTPPIRTAEDLHRQWRALMGPLGFSGRSLWIAFLTADDRVMPLLPRFDELPPRPSRGFTGAIPRVCADLLASEGEPDGSVAFLLSRPGPAVRSAGDRAWGAALLGDAARARLHVRPSFLATDEAVVALDHERLADAA